MKSFHYLFILLAVCAFAACAPEEESQAELQDQDASGVVMIVNKYYYKVDIDGNNNVVYTTGFDSNGNFENLYFEEKDIKEKTAVISGTGFFISKDGMILTNRHVASPSLDRVAVKNASKNFISNMLTYCELEKIRMSYEYDSLEKQKQSCYGYNYYGYPVVNQSRYDYIETQQSELSSNYQEANNMINSLNSLDMSDLKFELVSELYVAFNNSFVTNFSDMQSCVLAKQSEDVDLATIQLKSKTTPTDAHVFNTTGTMDNLIFYQEEPVAEEQVGRQVYMIGYNAGFIVSNTKQGIQAQITDGKISQEPDGQRILYSIPCLQGSSGSPIVDAYNRLVGVNFAGLQGTQSFNYGIPLEKVQEFLRQ